MHRYVLLGGVVAFLLVAGIGGGSAMMQVSGAVIANGQLAVESSVKRVQHPTGGVVAHLYVRNGDLVKKGDLLARLDDTVARTNLAIISKALVELAAREARLVAERLDQKFFDFPALLISRADEPEISALMSREEKAFRLRYDQRVGQQSQLKERITQLRNQIQGLSIQAEATAKEVELVQRELAGVRELWTKRLITMTRISSLERDAVRLTGQREQLLAEQFVAQEKIKETELQILQIEKDLQSEVSKELREISAKRADLKEREAAAQDVLKRVDIRAPQDGVVNQLSVFTVGGVVSAGELIMQIVPEADALVTEARIFPQDIEQVQVGQAATIRFTTLNEKSTPELNGRVTVVSPDLMQDQRTGVGYYLVRIEIMEHELEKLGRAKLVSGMPAEVFIRTRSRTLLSYLIKPMQEQVMKIR
jgi:HlyD family secretion protein